jgi:DNA-binding LacI/PurR family transcriptional regulator
VTTILDVARLAEVSIATVSRVINGDAAMPPRAAFASAAARRSGWS